MAFNLSRNTIVYISTVTSGFGPTNTFEVPILDGYDFSQDAASETVGLDEAGDAPVRGQKVFNTALNPANVSFTTYMRPFKDTSNHTCIERILWEALVGAGDGATVLGTNSVSDTTSLRIDFENSNKHELLKLYIYFKLDNTVYKVSEVQINTAEIDFSISGIAQITWSGQGTALIKDNAPLTWTGGTEYLAASGTAEFIKNKLSTMTLTNNGGAVTPGYATLVYSAALASTDLTTYAAATVYTADINVDGTGNQTITIDTNTYSGTTVNDALVAINDQLDDANVGLNSSGEIVITSQSQGTGSTVVVTPAATNDVFGFGTSSNGITPTGVNDTSNTPTGGTGTGTVYNIPITGGSLTISNNITFLTPEELGKVNQPIGSFTGARSVSGNVTAYLRTGTTESGGLLDALLADLTTVTHDFNCEISAGGINNLPNATFTLPHAHLVIPSTQVDSVISTSIDFTGLGQDIEFSDELLVEYKAS